MATVEPAILTDCASICEELYRLSGRRLFFTVLFESDAVHFNAGPIGNYVRGRWVAMGVSSEKGDARDYETIVELSMKWLRNGRPAAPDRQYQLAYGAADEVHAFTLRLLA